MDQKPILAGSFNGRTAGFEPVYEGSIPSPATKRIADAVMPIKIGATFIGIAVDPRPRGGLRWQARDDEIVIDADNTPITGRDFFRLHDLPPV